MFVKVLFVRKKAGQMELSTIRNRLPRTARDLKFHTTCRYIVRIKIRFLFSSHSACVVYTKTITHLSVGESDGYLPPLR